MQSAVEKTECHSQMRTDLNGVTVTLSVTLFCLSAVGCTVPAEADFAAPETLNPMMAVLYEMYQLDVGAQAASKRTYMQLETCAVGITQSECDRYCSVPCEYHFEYTNNPITFTYHYNISGLGNKNMSRDVRMPEYFCPKGKEASPPEEITNLPSSGVVRCGSELRMKGQGVDNEIKLESVCPNAVDCTRVPSYYFVDQDTSEVGRLVHELVKLTEAVSKGVNIKSDVTMCAAGDTLQECNRLCRATCYRQDRPGKMTYSSYYKVVKEGHATTDSVVMELPMPLYFCPKKQAFHVVEPFPPWAIATIVLGSVWFVLAVTLIIAIIWKKVQQRQKKLDGAALVAKQSARRAAKIGSAKRAVGASPQAKLL